MPPPSQLVITTSSVRRLVKEEASYHKELEKQRAHVQNLEANPNGEENAEFQLSQEKQAITETLAVFPSLRERLTLAVQKLSDQIEESREGATASQEELSKAKEAILDAEKVLEDSRGESGV